MAPAIGEENLTPPLMDRLDTISHHLGCDVVLGSPVTHNSWPVGHPLRRIVAAELIGPFFLARFHTVVCGVDRHHVRTLKVPSGPNVDVTLSVGNFIDLRPFSATYQA